MSNNKILIILLVILLGAITDVAGLAGVQALSAEEKYLLGKTLAAALESRSSKPCVALKENMPGQFEDCIKGIALITLLPENCEAFADPSQRVLCLAPVAFRLDNKALCKGSQDCLSQWDDAKTWKGAVAKSLKKISGWQAHIGETNFPPIRKKDCEEMGGSWSGSWTGVDLPLFAVCRFRTSDPNMQCGDSSECQSRFCKAQGRTRITQNQKALGVCTEVYPGDQRCSGEVIRGTVWRHPCG